MCLFDSLHPLTDWLVHRSDDSKDAIRRYRSVSPLKRGQHRKDAQAYKTDKQHQSGWSSARTKNRMLQLKGSRLVGAHSTTESLKYKLVVECSRVQEYKGLITTVETKWHLSKWKAPQWLGVKTTRRHIQIATVIFEFRGCAPAIASIQRIPTVGYTLSLPCVILFFILCHRACVGRTCQKSSPEWLGVKTCDFTATVLLVESFRYCILP
jgi:hypothetical protein